LDIPKGIGYSPMHIAKEREWINCDRKSSKERST
jgi:hypothetical protein